MSSENNKRIAKNTLMLYIRMLLIMGVSLFTVRVVLDTLGVVDYGLYNVVGGIVAMFTFLSSTLSSASQRFFAFELGRDNSQQLKKIFSVTLVIYVVMAIIILIIAETIGLWFLNNKLTIPESRIEAVQWVYQFSILSFIATLMAIPYNATIIAHEKMKVYAYVSIIQVVLKLAIVYMLFMFSIDKLKLYSVLTFGVTLLTTLIYYLYSSRKFKECHFNFYWDNNLFKEIIGYSGWNIIGALSNILRDQGVNILINIFFNPAINAARGIAYKINSTLLQFTNNFYVAVKPQITKSYSSGDKEYMKQLVIRSAKVAYFLMLFLSIPILIETNFILGIWLKELPEYVIIFSRLAIINSLIDVMNLPLVATVQATGRIKLYQTTISLIYILNLPISYIFLKVGYPPQTTILVSILLSTISFIPRLIIFEKITKISAGLIFKNAFLKAIIVSICSLVFPFIIYFLLEEGFVRFILVSLTDVFITAIIIYYIGLTKDEKFFVINYIKKKLNLRALNKKT